MVGASRPVFMTYLDIDPHNWRNDPGLSCIIEYKKRFAFFPVKCADGTKVWFRHYYKKYELWSHNHAGSGSKYRDSDYLHTDFIENITEPEYIVRKLSETL